MCQESSACNTHSTHVINNITTQLIKNFITVFLYSCINHKIIPPMDEQI